MSAVYVRCLYCGFEDYRHHKTVGDINIPQFHKLFLWSVVSQTYSQSMSKVVIQSAGLEGANMLKPDLLHKALELYTTTGMGIVILSNNIMVIMLSH